jgi:hypothetical protein
MNNLPEYIEKTLDEWEFISYYAYDNFERHGRGSVIIFYEDNNIKFSYINREYFLQNKKNSELKLLDMYDPENEFIVTFEENKGTRTIRIRTPENGRNPKGIWFFRTLEKINNDPNISLKDLPVWFIKALDELIKLQDKDK